MILCGISSVATDKGVFGGENGTALGSKGSSGSKALDQLLRDSVFRALMDGWDEAILLCTPSGRVFYANSQAGQVLGQPCEHLVGQELPLEQATEANAAASGKQLLHCLREGEPWCGKVTLAADPATPTLFQLAAYPGREPSSGQLFVVIKLSRCDATATITHQQETARINERLQEEMAERAAVEETLENVLLHQQAILSNIPDMAWLKDRESRFIAVNEPLARLAGAAPADLVGKNDFDICPPELAGRYREDDFEVMRTGHSKRVVEPHPFLHDDHSVSWIETIKTPVFDKEDRCIGTTGIARDITERKQLEEKLKQSERLAAVGTLAAGIAHELNNPLGICLLAVAQAQRLAATEARNCAKLLEPLQDIDQELRRCGRIVQSILHFSEEAESEKWSLDLGELVKQSVKVANSKLNMESLTFTLILPDKPARAIVNPTEVQQVLVNIITNAAYASPENGEVRVQIDNLTDVIRICIADQGAGHESADLGRALDPHYAVRRQRSGSGLGLSLVHGIVSKHGGTVSIESPGNGGTVVTIKLPKDTNTEF